MLSCFPDCIAVVVSTAITLSHDILCSHGPQNVLVHVSISETSPHTKLQEAGF